MFCLNRGVVNLKSSKQDIVTDYTTKAGYIATSKATKEALWIKKFITDLLDFE